MGQFVRERNWRQCWNTYKELPASAQVIKTRDDDAAFGDAVGQRCRVPGHDRRFSQAHPNDAMIDLISVDAYILRKAYDKALEAIDRVDKAIGRDPYLKVLRGNVLLREKKRTRPATWCKTPSCRIPTCSEAITV